mmetsp:Transcript_114806/g.161245  ORF Transcript_114806/g.161245 Transcript_114806/m.161245 type:complete len:382 (+) Transcript_114806:30-1175(+)
MQRTQERNNYLAQEGTKSTPTALGTTAHHDAPPKYQAGYEDTQHTTEGPYGNESNTHIWEGGLGFPPGIKAEFARSAEAFATRYWIIDNSGSMTTADGHLTNESADGSCRATTCSRWAELSSTIAFHAETAIALQAPTEFRLLNHPGRGSQVVRVGESHTPTDAAQAAVQQLCASQPTGRTPLCSQIREVVHAIHEQVAQLRTNGKRVVVVIASDGEATDGNIAHALAPLKDLPVWVVIRLCTDDESVVKYWNNIEEDLELEMDVLDDVDSEAREVNDHAPWFTYGKAMHRLREWGAVNKILDVIDERPLVAHELVQLVRLIYGDTAADLPQPDVKWSAFKHQLETEIAKYPMVWDPLREKKRPWIKVGTKLTKNFKPKRW